MPAPGSFEAHLARVHRARRQTRVLHRAPARPRREREERARVVVELGEENVSQDVGGEGPEEGTEPVFAVLGPSGCVAEGPAHGVVVVMRQRRTREGVRPKVEGAPHPQGGAFSELPPEPFFLK